MSSLRLGLFVCLPAAIVLVTSACASPDPDRSASSGDDLTEGSAREADEANRACPGPGLTSDEAAQAFVADNDHYLSYGTFADRSRTRQCVGATCGAWSEWAVDGRSSFSSLSAIQLDLSNDEPSASILYRDGTQNVMCNATTKCALSSAGVIRCEAMRLPTIGPTYRYPNIPTYGCSGVFTDTSLHLEGKLTTSCAYLSGIKREPGLGGATIETQLSFANGRAQGMP